MVVALMSMLDERILDTIDKYVDKRPTSDGKPAYGFKFIYTAAHYITQRGNPSGGYVYFFRERRLGW